MIYVLPIEGAFVPPREVDPQLRAERRLAQHFGQKVKRLSAVTMGVEELAALRPGDIVVGNMAITKAHEVLKRKARLFCHYPNGDLVEMSGVVKAESAELRNPPWRAGR